MLRNVQHQSGHQGAKADRHLTVQRLFVGAERRCFCWGNGNNRIIQNAGSFCLVRLWSTKAARFRNKPRTPREDATAPNCTTICKFCVVRRGLTNRGSLGFRPVSRRRFCFYETALLTLDFIQCQQRSTACQKAIALTFPQQPTT